MKRALTALVLIPIFCYLILWAPDPLFWVALAAVAVVSFREYAHLAELHQIQRLGVFGYGAGLLLLFLPEQQLVVIILAALLALALSLRAPREAAALPYASVMIFGILYVFGCLRYSLELRRMDHYWLLFALSLNWVGDIAALYIGRAIGRHKLSPMWSPGKSWEGAVASVIASVVYAAIYFRYLLPSVPLAEALIIAVVANIAGQFGDLCESALKRGAGVKDSGSFLPGHGGWLDRIDSSLFALPVVYVLATNLRW